MEKIQLTDGSILQSGKDKTLHQELAIGNYMFNPLNTELNPICQ